MAIKDPITTGEAARILGCDPSAVRHRIANGLESEMFGRDRMVSRKAIESIKKNANGRKRGRKPAKKR